MRLVSSIILSLFLLILVTSCSKENQKSWIRAVPTKYITEFSDTVFFKWVQDIEQVEEHWIVLDKGAGQTHVVDNDFNYIRSIGQPGPGPEEIKGAGNVEVADGILYVYDYTDRKINAYSPDGRFLNSRRTYSFNSEFFIESSKLYLCSNEDPNSPIEVVDLQTDTIAYRFGQAAVKALNYPPQHVARLGDHIITAYVWNRPVIDSYDLNGNFLDRLDLSSGSILSTWLEESDIEGMIKSSTPNMQRAKAMFWDIYVANGHFYLMTPHIKTEKGDNTPFLIQFSVDNEGEISIDQYIHLQAEAGWSFNCFALSENGSKIIAYDPGNGALVEFLVER